jgi:hypothetical protein
MYKMKNEEQIHHKVHVFSHAEYISLTIAIIDFCKRKVGGGGIFSNDDNDKGSPYWQTL